MANFDETLREFEVVQKDDIAEFSAAVQQMGAAAIPKELQRRLEKWKEVPLQVGVTGVSGVGKSSFINAVRRLKPKERGAAAVGVTETTTVPTPYPHPQNPRVQFWDLPGVGTPKFPRANYLELVEFEKYDFFIIICSDRFTENDLWLAKEIKEKKKKFYFVRTKIDFAISNDKADDPEGHNEKSLIEKIRQDCTGQLCRAGFDRPTVFLICKVPHLYDFPELEKTFVLDIPGLKRDVALYSIRSTSTAIIKEKTKALLKRCWQVAAMSAAAALIPVPGVSLAADTALILREINFYKQVYGLDDVALEQLSAEAGMSKETLTRQLAHNAWLTCTATSLVGMLCTAYSAEIAVEETARAVPIIGFFIASSISYYVTKKVLEKIVGSMESAAIEVIEMTFKKASEVD